MNTVLNVAMVAVLVLSAAWVYSDAEARGLPTLKWTLLVLLMWIICLPAYLLGAEQQGPASIRKPSAEPTFPTNRLPGWFLLVIGLAIVAVQLNTFFKPSVPSCDSPEVVATAGRAIRNAPMVRALGLELDSLSHTSQTSYDKSEGVRHCSTLMYQPTGEERITFTVRWQDRKAHLMWVEVGPK